MPLTGNEAEWQTRKLRIDTKLLSLNPPWQIIPWHDGLDTSQLTCHAVTEFPTENGPADYALFVNGILIGIIEAKKVTVNPQNVLEQAKRYSRGAANGPGNWKPGDYEQVAAKVDALATLIENVQSSIKAS